MQSIQERLNSRSAGRILDVATGQGAALKFLIDASKDYESAVGVDIEDRLIEAAKSQFDDPRITFQKQPAEDLQFVDNSFDTIIINYSLHHLRDPKKALSEIKRVLKPGGMLIISEMHQTSPTPRQLTQIMWHHLGSEIDQIIGICHNQTFERDELIRLIEESGLVVQEIVKEDDNKPVSKEQMEQAVDILRQRLEQLAGHPRHEEMKVRVDEIRERLDTIGCALPPALVFLCTKA